MFLPWTLNRTHRSYLWSILPVVGLLAGSVVSSCAWAETEDARTTVVEVMAKQEIHHHWRPRRTVVPEEKLLGNAQPDAHGMYGGWKNRQVHGTGFFRVEQDPEGLWWLIDPTGHPFITVGINSVRPDDTKRGHAQMRESFGSKEKWADQAANLLRENAFNSLGAWSYSRSIRSNDQPLPFTRMINFMADYSQRTNQSDQGTGHRDYPNDLIPVFDPQFEQFCQTEGKKLQDTKNDPWLIGFFSDNELPFPPNALDRYLLLPDTAPGRVAAMDWLRDRKVQPEAINDDIRAGFLRFAAERYFRICREAIKANDSNHLYLGCRFHAKVLWQEPVFRAAAQYLDVVSINWYGQWTPDRTTMDNWVSWTNRPFLISEFFAKGMDSGLPNTSGAGWIVKTQDDRGLFYQNFTLPLIQHPGCVGWHWFRYLDNNPDDVPADPSNADANKGIVDRKFTPYERLLTAMSRINHCVYQLRTQRPAAAP